MTARSRKEGLNYFENIVLSRSDYELLLSELGRRRQLLEETRERLEGRLAEQARLTMLAVRDLGVERGSTDLSGFARSWLNKNRQHESWDSLPVKRR